MKMINKTLSIFSIFLMTMWIVGCSNNIPKNDNILHDNNFSFLKTFGSDNYEIGYSLLEKDDLGYILLGTISNYETIIISTDPEGEEEWRHIYSFGPVTLGRKLIKTNDNGYAVVGTIWYNSGNSSIILFKIDSLGILQWYKIFAVSDRNEGFFILQTLDMGFIIGGETCEIKPACNGDVLIIKTDSSGNMIWSSKFDNGGSEYVNSIIELSNFDLLILGSSNSFDVHKYYHTYLLKTDYNGELIWQKTFNYSMTSEGRNIINATDGQYYIFGNYQDATFSTGISIINIDESGSVIWVKKNESENGTLFSEEDVVKCRNSSIALIGLTNYAIAVDAPLPNSDVLLIRIDHEGNIIDEREYGGNLFDAGYSIVECADSEFVVTGLTYSYGIGNGDILFFKTKLFK